MSTENLSIFILGITGYIGGAASVALKKKYPSHNYSAFTRSASKVSAIEKLGIKAVVGTGTPEKDLQVISDAASKADVVINAADADDVKLTETILDAIKRSSKKLPIYIHTSGTGVVSDKPTGNFQEPGRVWDDNNPQDIRDLGPDQPHRQIDLAIFNAGKERHFIGYIIAPSTIYGVAFDNPVHQLSAQIPDLIRIAVKKRQTVYGGGGTNRWNNVHIYDMAALYVQVFEKAIKERQSGSFSEDPYERFYFASVRTHVWGDVARQLAPLLFEKGVVDSKEAVSTDPSEVLFAATNSLSVSNRGLKEGWKPTYPTLEDTLREDVVAVLAELGL